MYTLPMCKLILLYTHTVLRNPCYLHTLSVCVSLVNYLPKI